MFVAQHLTADGNGLLERPLASYDFFGWGESGKGSWVTIYTNSGHAYMVVAGLRFAGMGDPQFTPDRSAAPGGASTSSSGLSLRTCLA